MLKHITSLLLFLIFLIFSNLAIADENNTGKITHENLCKDYFDSLVWTTHYYFNECIDWRWSTKFNEGPLTGGDGSVIYNNFNKNINNKKELMDSVTYYYKKSSKNHNNDELINLYNYINNMFYKY